MAKLINEIGDLGDRMQLGLSHTAPGGSINPGVNTFSSPTVTQDVNKFTPSIAGSQVNINTNIPNNLENSKDDIVDIKKDIDAIKYKVTPDDIIMGINVELKNMVFKRPDVAKQLVINNLKTDPEYYKKLKFVDVEDTIDESKKYMNSQEIAIFDIIKEMKSKRKK